MVRNGVMSIVCIAISVPSMLAAVMSAHLLLAVDHMIGRWRRGPGAAIPDDGV